MDSERFFQACKRDTCSCDNGGDCECYCSNVAAYAAACNAVGVCVKWRSPTTCRESPSLLLCRKESNIQRIDVLASLLFVCSYCADSADFSILFLCILLTHIFSCSSAIFCDYYNPSGECEWHYQPCGKPCLKTCKNPSGKCDRRLPALEGTDQRVLYSVVER